MQGGGAGDVVHPDDTRDPWDLESARFDDWKPLSGAELPPPLPAVCGPYIDIDVTESMTAII